MGVYKRGDIWWFKFNWHGETIRESTKQSNKRVAEQVEAARRTSLAKGEVGIRDRQKAPTVAEFGQKDFLPAMESTFASKPKTFSYYRNGVKRMLEFRDLAQARLDAVSSEMISSYVAKRRADKLEVSSINRELQVLRRMFHLAQEWGKTEKALPRIRMLPGEKHRERVISPDEEAAYLQAASDYGQELLAAYERGCREGIRATQRGEQLIPPADPFRLHHAATILLDCALRPEECFRLRWENIREGMVEIHYGKTGNARRKIPLSPRSITVLEMRRATASTEWVFPSGTRSGHIEPSTLKGPHEKACTAAGLEDVTLYTFRHTCLTRWAPHMDPWTLAYLAGHRDMSITKRYVHPQQGAIREAMEKSRSAQTGHKFGHSEKNGPEAADPSSAVIN